MNQTVWKSFYYLLRPLIPLNVRWYLQRKAADRVNGFSTQPMWPLPELKKIHERNFWPQNLKTALILTHDVDTQFGFDHIRDVCEVEKRLEFKSSWNIVPDLYKVDEETLDYLRNSGMEIGVHDWNHDGKLFLDKSLFDARISKINQVIKEWGAKGFRAGMVFHNDAWMQELECDYDSSYYDTDPYQPVGGGCCSIWPFMLGHLMELPYTMPQDHVLFVAKAEVKVPKKWDESDDGRKRVWEWIRDYCRRIELATDAHRHTQTSIMRTLIKSTADLTQHPYEGKCQCFAEKHEEKSIQARVVDRIVLRGVDIWKMKAEWLVERGGMVLMLTHPDYLCHPKIIRRLRRLPRIRKGNKEYDGWLGSDNRDVQEVRDRSIIEKKWQGSLLEQYAAFLNWFKREYEGWYWHCLPMEIADWFRSADYAG